jgi:electron transfer flavoprotein beta subunit
VKIPGSGDRVDTTGLEWKPNPFDEYALEAALRLTENGQQPKVRAGEVVVVTFGPKETETTLRAALATGADKAIRVDATDDQLDGDLVARALKTLVEREKPDLVVMGKQAVDGDSNQVGQILAELLDWPMATFAATIEEEAGRPCSSAARSTAAWHAARQAARGGHRGSAHRRPDQRVLDEDGRTFKYNDGVRFAALPAIMAAKKKPLTEVKLAELAADTKLKVTTRSSRRRRRARRASRSRTSPSSSRAQKRGEGPLSPPLAPHPKRRHIMASVLVIAEIAEGKLKKTTHSAVTFARRAPQGHRAARSRSSCSAPAPRRAAELRRFGASEVLVADDASLAQLHRRALRSHGGRGRQGLHVVVGTASAFGKDLMPRVAARLGAGYAGDITELGRGRGDHKRPMFAGNAFGSPRSRRPSTWSACGRARSPRPSRPAARRPWRSRSPSPPSGAAARVEFVSSTRSRASAPSSPRRRWSSLAAAR